MGEWVKFDDHIGYFIGIHYHEGKIINGFYHGCYSEGEYKLREFKTGCFFKEPEYIFMRFPDYPKKLLEKVSVYKNKIRKEKLKKINDDIRRLEMDIEKLKYEKNKLIEEQEKKEEMKGALSIDGKINEEGALSLVKGESDENNSSDTSKDG